jgi:4a-hydroxytetrahydrobiopterin dehydratase
MSELANLKCEPCRAGGKPASEAEIARWREEIPQWRLVEREGVRRLERSFSFPDFASALSLADRIGRAADEEGHHPALLVEWGKLRVEWWTHRTGGLHRNDFIMAARTDRLSRTD